MHTIRDKCQRITVEIIVMKKNSFLATANKKQSKPSSSDNATLRLTSQNGLLR